MTEVRAKDCAVCGKLFVKKPTDSQRYWEQRKCCSYECSVEIRRGRPNPKLAAANRGRKQPPEEVARRAATLANLRAQGKVRNARANLGLRGAETSQWKGDDVSYRAAHARLKNHRGPAACCDHCDTTEGWVEWALKHDAEVVKLQVGGAGDGLRYSPRPSDYFPLCRPCHRVYDARKRDPRTGRYS